MNKKQCSIFLLICLSIYLAACSRSEIGQTSLNTSENTNLIAKNASGADKKSGGQVTVIAGEDIALVKMRSTRFR